MSMSTEERLYWKRVRVERGWHAANCGVSKRKWFVTRETWTGNEWLMDKNDDHMIRFASYEAAQRRADQLNSATAAA